jgi:hypothetical protein
MSGKLLPALLMAGLVACGGSEAKVARSPSPSIGGAGAPARASPPDASRLVGQWMRTDADYTVVIDDVTSDGRIVARYLNPRPINVARAAWKEEAGRLRVLVELRDRGYPGSNYELAYDPASDALYGVYHHLGLNQDFDVSFYRGGKGGGTRP